MKLYSLLLFLATTSLCAQTEETVNPEPRYQNILSAAFHFYPKYGFDRLLEGETNVNVLPAYGVGFSYTGRILFKNQQRHFLDASANVSIYSIRVEVANIDNSVLGRGYAFHAHQDRSNIGLSVDHNIIFYQTKKIRFFANYGIRMLYFISKKIGIGLYKSRMQRENDEGSTSHMELISLDRGNKLIPMIDIGLGMDLATKKGFGRAWTMEICFSWDFIRRMADGLRAVSYYTSQDDDPATIAHQGGGTFYTSLSHLSFKFGKKF